MNDWVRPTQRCLEELGVAVPDLGLLLHEIEHPLVVRAQQVPERVRAGSAERIRSISDRVWFKVKTNDWRGAAGDLDRVAQNIGQTWWIVTAGRRAKDSPQRDFYDRLEAETHRAGRNTCDSTSLYPNDWDRRRLEAEAATKAARLFRNLTRRAACESLANDDIRGFVVAEHDVRVRLSVHEDGRAYIAIGATGSIDRHLMATVLSAIPGLSSDDWMPEPSAALGLESMPGEVLWSAMIGPDHQAELLAWADKNI